MQIKRHVENTWDEVEGGGASRPYQLIFIPDSYVDCLASRFIGVFVSDDS